MNTRYDEVAAEALRLSVRDRVRLAQHLASSVDDETDTDVEALWFEEAQRRLEELRSGKVQGMDAAEAFESARKALRR